MRRSLVRAGVTLGIVSIVGIAVGLVVTAAIISADNERETRQQLIELAEAYQRETGEAPPIEVSIPLPEVEGQDGEDGEDGRDGEDGAPGRPPTDAELAAAVFRFCAANDGCRGPQGAPGADGRDGVSIPGEPGSDGHDGSQGPPGPSCPVGYVLSRLPPPLDEWLACAPEVAGG